MLFRFLNTYVVGSVLLFSWEKLFPARDKKPEWYNGKKMKIISTSENGIVYSRKITDVIIDHPAHYILAPPQTQCASKKKKKPSFNANLQYA